MSGRDLFITIYSFFVDHTRVHYDAKRIGKRRTTVRPTEETHKIDSFESLLATLVVAKPRNYEEFRNNKEVHN